MTVTTVHNRMTYIAGAGQTVFPYTFLVLAAADLLVYKDSVLQSPVGYTVSNLGLGSGGNVTFNTPLAGGEEIILLRATDLTQQVDLLEGSKLPADPTEGMWDKLHCIVQDLHERLSRPGDITLEIGAGYGLAQCRLWCWGEVLNLEPYTGNQIWVDGALRTLTGYGPLLAPTGLTPGVLYYIYVRWTGTVLVLESSTTGWTMTDGLRHKTGDPSRTLVGLVRPVDVAGTTHFLDQPAQRLVQSAHNSLAKDGLAYLTTSRTLAAGAEAEIHSEIRIEFLVLASRTDFPTLGARGVAFALNGTLFTTHADTLGRYTNSRIFLNGAAIAGLPLMSISSGATLNISTSTVKTLTEGYYLATVYGSVDGTGATATWLGDPDNVLACRLNILLPA